MDGILVESSLIHQQAEKLLHDLRIVEMWESIGAEVRTVGSFRSNLMIDKDIDLHVYTKELDAAKTFRHWRLFWAIRVSSNASISTARKQMSIVWNGISL